MTSIGFGKPLATTRRTGKAAGELAHLHHDLVRFIVSRGALMNSRWIRSNEILLTCFVIAVVLSAC
jgi:hypothetical protein